MLKSEALRRAGGRRWRRVHIGAVMNFAREDAAHELGHDDVFVLA
jgi:hypothetical protein